MFSTEMFLSFFVHVLPAKRDQAFVTKHDGSHRTEPALETEFLFTRTIKKNNGKPFLYSRHFDFTFNFLAVAVHRLLFF